VIGMIVARHSYSKMRGVNKSTPLSREAVKRSGALPRQEPARAHPKGHKARRDRARSKGAASDAALKKVLVTKYQVTREEQNGKKTDGKKTDERANIDDLTRDPH
jgi:hypothetical protein